jgi:hypothetical protein
MEIAVKMVERSSEGASGGGSTGDGAGDSFPATGIMGERRPLAPFLHGFMGALLHGDGIHGEAKTWLWWLQIRGWRCLPRARVLPLYSLSDSHLPILGRNGAGLSRPSGLKIR